MQALLAVFLEDLRKRRLVFGIALFLGLAAAGLPFVPSNRNLPADDLRQAAALAFLTLFLALVPLFLGADLFTPRQAGGRSGFFLSRPLRPWQILGGRLGSAFAACFGGALLILLPSGILGVDFLEVWMAESRESISRMISFTHPAPRFVLYLPGFGAGTEPASPLLLAGIPLVLLALGHALSVFVRLGGWWSLFDLVVAAWIGRIMLARHFEILSLQAKVSAWPLFGGVFVAGCALGLWLQLRRGGTERFRLHRLFSLSVAIPLLLTAFATEIWIDRLEGRGPQHLERVHFATASASGDQLLLVGDLGTHVGAFLVDRKSATWRHFAIVDSWHVPRFVADDLFWTRCIVGAGATRLEDTTCRLLSLRLVEARHPEERPDLRHLVPGLGLLLGETADPRHFDVGPNGRRVAVYRDGALELVSWPSLETTRVVPLVQDPLWVRYDESGGLRTWTRSVGPDGASRQVLVSELGADGLRPVAHFDGPFRDLPEDSRPPDSELDRDPRSWKLDRDAGCLTAPDDGERYCFGELSGPG